MKKNFLFFFLFLICISANSQSWAAFGARWNYSYNAFNQTGYVEISKAGDTIISGKTCDILLTSRYVYDYASGSYYTFLNIDTNYTYGDSGKVYFFINNTFRKLYDFNVIVGDTVFVKEAFPSAGFCNLQDTSIVDSTGSMIINGDTLKYYHLHPFSQYSWHQSGRIVEKLGCLGYLFPENNCVLDYFESGPFRCYHDNSLWSYETGQVPCDFIIMGIDEVESANTFSIYPNPNSGIFTILTSERNGQFEILNSLGQIVWRTKIQEVQSEINLCGLADGLYFVRMNSENGSFASKKIIVE
ncbi:hypothetical protein BH09BAC5_BH09BAC5_26460 [soil metagenome]